MNLPRPGIKTLFDPTHHPLLFRAISFVVILLVSMLYTPINQNVSGGIAPVTALDDFIPLTPIWAVPYILALVWWVAAIIWAAAKMETALLKTFALAVIIVTLSSYLVYLLYPTYVVRPEPAGASWTMDLIRIIYGNDQPYNALPSGHTYNTSLIAIFWWHWKPSLRWLWVATVPVVILATLFTKQHYCLDPFFGLLWAFGAFFLAKKITGWNPESSGV